ncbi:MAG: signal peptidase I [Sphaerochaetaceae bacterium]|nr:signal peptidase I [Sphaerochaetaceae bacterium]
MENIQEKNKIKYRIANIVFWIVLAVVAIYSVVALTSSDDSETSIFGQTAFTVQTDSMSPTFEAGDLIFVDTDFELSEIEVGDVITYQTLIDVDGDGEAELVYNSHRVTEIIIQDDGDFQFVTQGDNNSSVDDEVVNGSYVRGVWTGKVWSNMGGVIDGIVSFLKSGTGFFIFIVLPCLAFLVYEVVRFVNVMTEYKTQEALAGREKLKEEALALARKQLEEEAKKKAETTKNTEEKDE